MSINNPAIAKKLLGKGGAFITRQYLRDAKSMNPIKRIRAMRALSKISAGLSCTENRKDEK
jgi:hypothetical protein